MRYTMTPYDGYIVLWRAIEYLRDEFCSRRIPAAVAQRCDEIIQSIR